MPILRETLLELLVVCNAILAEANKKGVDPKLRRQIELLFEVAVKLKKEWNSPPR